MIATLAICPVCLGERWLCQDHPDNTWPHDDCAAPGRPCPSCNTSEQPEFGPELGVLQDDEDE